MTRWKRGGPGARHAGIAATLSLAVLLGGCSRPVDGGWSGYVEGDFLYVAAPVAGTLKALQVRQGDTVTSGAALFQLDDVSSQAARAEADARVAVARAQASNLDTGRRPDELAAIRAQLAQARASATRADAELKRQRELLTQDFISRSRLDDAVTAAAQARARVEELGAQLRAAELPARPGERSAAQAGADAAAQARAQAAWREQQAVQRAPTAALVAETFYQPGEYVAAGQPVVSLLPPDRRRARFFVNETDVGQLAIGAPVTLRCDGCGAAIAARIRFIAPQAEYTPPVIYSNAQRAKLVFRVEAVPEQPADAVRLHPGQPLDVFRQASP